MLTRKNLLSNTLSTLLFVGTIVLQGCSMSRGSIENGGSLGEILLDEEVRRGEVQVVDDPQADADLHFLLGELAFDDENYELALNEYKDAYEVQTEPSRTLSQRLMTLSIHFDEFSEALVHIDELLKSSGVKEKNRLLRLKSGILISQKEFAEARTSLKSLVKVAKAPLESDYLALARVELALGAPDKAELALRKFLKLKPKSPRVRNSLAAILIKQGKAKEAVSVARKLVKDYPQSRSAKISLVKMHAAAGNIEEAKKALTELLKKYPDNSKLHKLSAFLELKSKNPNKAIEDLKIAGDLEADSFLTRLQIALVKMERGKAGHAETDLKILLSEQPDNDRVKYFLGLSLANSKKVNSAISTLKRVSPNNPNLFRASRTLASDLLRRSGRNLEAISFIEEALEIAPDDTRLLSVLGFLQRETKNQKDAVKTYEKLLEIQPKNVENLFMLGVLYDSIGDKDKSIKTMKAVLEESPDNSNALNFIAYSYAERGIKLKSAYKLINEALETEPENGYFIDTLAWIKFKQGKFSEAYAHLLKATELVPNDPVILKHLGQTLEELGNKKQALRTYKKALNYVENSEEEGVENYINERIKILDK